MKRQFLKVIKVAACISFALAVSLTGISIPDIAKQKIVISTVAEAATVTNRLPIVTYTRYCGNLATYTTSTYERNRLYLCKRPVYDFKSI